MSTGDDINLDTQVQRVLDPAFGGTGNQDAWGEGLIEKFWNQDAGVLTIGDVVSFKNRTDTTKSGSIAVQKTTTLDDPDCLGPVVGTYTVYGANIGQFEVANPSNDMFVAVMRYGRTTGLSIGSNGGVSRGHYIYAVGSNGQVYGEARLKRGALGTWLANGSNGARGALAEIGQPFNMSPYGTRVSANFLIDGGGSVPANGQKGTMFFDWSGVIEGWTAVGDTTTGSCVIELWKDAYPNFPNSADNITASAPVSIPSNSQMNFSDVLTGWTTTISARDLITVNLNTVQTFTKITLDLKIRRLT